MPDFRSIFRRCPNCGKRFEIQLTSKKLLNEKEITTNEEEIDGLEPVVVGGPSNPHVLQENVPFTIDEREFNYSYKCKHCGHVWYEVVDKERRVNA